MALTKRQKLTRLTVAEAEFRLATTILVNSAANLSQLLDDDTLNRIADASLVIQRASSNLRRLVLSTEQELDAELSDP
jgi:hypothetical protein